MFVSLYVRWVSCAQAVSIFRQLANILIFSCIVKSTFVIVKINIKNQKIINWLRCGLKGFWQKNIAAQSDVILCFNWSLTGRLTQTIVVILRQVWDDSDQFYFQIMCMYSDYVWRVWCARTVFIFRPVRPMYCFY